MIKKTAIEVRNLSVTYQGGVQAVRNCSFSVAKGEIVGLVGESGSGKTSALMAIPRLLPVGTTVAGQILCDGHDLTALPEETLNTWRWRRMALTPQGAMNSFTPHLTVERHITEVLTQHLGMAQRKGRERAGELLRDVDLEQSLLSRYPHELSGGQKQRAALAVALACEPDFLLADEPTTALDVVTQKEVLDTLVRLVRGRGMGLLLVTHDLPLAARLCDSLIVMKDGEIVESGLSQRVIDAPEHVYTQQLIEAIRIMDKKHGQRWELMKQAPVEQQPMTALLSVKSLGVCYKGRYRLLRGRSEGIWALKSLSFTLEKEGATLSIVGESGSGKTTLLRTLLGLVLPATGGVELWGQPLDAMTDEERLAARRRCGYVSQDPYGSLPPTLTVLGAVLEPWNIVHRRGRKHAEGSTKAKELLTELKLPENLWGARVRYALSGGQRQRVAIARALILEPELLLCDEPTAMQDVSTRGEVLEVLNRRVALGMSMILVTHDLLLARYAAKRALVLHKGEVVESGDSAELLERPYHPYTRALLAALPRI
ncbi:MAG: ABC transporter ATP-binding protein [Synergistaceae bacterium]|jgi:peptide/nickel transport system ATP-binding protein|nr:ABC transporter ATP-binding protein [Synergistaceae bacterium]